MRPLHHKLKTFQFRPYSLHLEGALVWSMVSTTSVERPKSVSWAPSEAMPVVSITPGGGEEESPLLEREGPSCPESPKESFQGETLGPRTILSPARMGLLAKDGPCPRVLSPELPGAEQLGERHSGADSATEGLDMLGSKTLDSELSFEMQTDKLLSQSTPTGAPTLWCEVSTPQASVPALTGCLLPGSDTL